jgi:hypothetical protein
LRTVALAFLLAGALVGGQGPEGTAVVKGRVVDAVTGKPIPRVTVRFSPQPRGPYTPGIDVQPPNRSAVTDSNGAFEVPRLAAADYTIYASGGGDYLGMEYGATAPGRSGTFLVVTDQSQQEITIKAWRAGSIAGRVIDERGRPVTGAQVRAFSRDPMAYGYSLSDDRGIYTISGLRPGEYGVGVNVSLSSRTVSPTAEGSPTSNGDSIFPYAIDRARRTVLIPSGAPLAPSTGEGRIQVYATAFFGGGITEGNAVRIPVRPGETRSEVDITLTAVRGVRVSGHVSAPDVKGVIVSLTPKGESAESAVTRIDATAASAGSFVFVAVPPGDYTLTAMRRVPPLTEVTLSGGSPAVAWDDVIGRDQEEWWAEMPLGIGDADIDDLAVQLSPGTVVTGSVLYEGSAVRPRERVAVTLALSAERSSATDRYPEIQPDGSFRIQLKPGRYRILAAQDSTGPAFRTGIVNGLEIADGPLVVGSEPLRNVQFAFAPPDTVIRGVISDRDGRRVPRGAVMIFPADRATWFRLDESHRARLAIVTDGTFAATGLLAGDYYVAAVEHARPGMSAVNAEAAMPFATRVTLRSGEPLTLNLTVEPRER